MSNWKHKEKKKFPLPSSWLWSLPRVPIHSSTDSVTQTFRRGRAYTTRRRRLFSYSLKLTQMSTPRMTWLVSTGIQNQHAWPLLLERDSNPRWEPASDQQSNAETIGPQRQVTLADWCHPCRSLPTGSSSGSSIVYFWKWPQNQFYVVLAELAQRFVVIGKSRRIRNGTDH